MKLPPAEGLELGGTNITVIGGTGGIGRALSRRLASNGAQVIVVGQAFRDQNVPGISFVKADLSSIKEAKRVAAELPVESADIVIFTTGIMAGPKREVTAEGIERDLAVSYLNRFAMLDEIAPRQGKDRAQSGVKPRVFIMGFPGTDQKAVVEDLNSERAYKRFSAHSNTVAGNEVLVLQAAKRYPRIDFFGLNPGFVKTNIRANLFGSRALLGVMEWLTGFMTIAPETYADRMAPLLVSRELEGRSGAMFNNKAQAILASPSAKDPKHAEALTAASLQLVARAISSQAKGG
ncbi:SDR family NAD(P)-dependent oxidoreductase [Bradyrhizobium shewense]|uniref:SDR family NAD(P)-dependent oxidoreductase n=1 Tax=Bradyrhizobium shewense TaxID=1761772 RepID=UPI001FD8F9AA|nr:SDR family NAD(P)-dependent oxidoreductase [Bradyrhizobium shewense]